MSELPVPSGTLSERGLVETAARIATDTARWGIRVAAAPTLPLPRPLQRAFLDSARLGLESLALFPRAFLHTLHGLAVELDDLEARGRRREDLGRRLRREARKAAHP